MLSGMGSLRSTAAADLGGAGGQQGEVPLVQAALPSVLRHSERSGSPLPGNTGATPGGPEAGMVWSAPCMKASH